MTLLLRIFPYLTFLSAYMKREATPLRPLVRFRTNLGFGFMDYSANQKIKAVSSIQTEKRVDENVQLSNSSKVVDLNEQLPPDSFVMHHCQPRTIVPASTTASARPYYRPMFQFTDPADLASWFVNSDEFCDGSSSATITGVGMNRDAKEGLLRFQGTVNENTGGGFDPMGAVAMSTEV